MHVYVHTYTQGHRMHFPYTCATDTHTVRIYIYIIIMQKQKANDAMIQTSHVVTCDVAATQLIQTTIALAINTRALTYLKLSSY